MKAMIKAAHKLMNDVKIEITTGRYQVLVSMGDKIVRIFQKPGRTLISCSCEHGARYCDSPVICKHKLVAIYKLMEDKNGTK